MSVRGRQFMWLLLGLGATIRLAFALSPADQGFDLQSEAAVNAALAHHGLHVYSALREGVLVGGARAYRWPYPPGFFPWIEIAGWLGTHTAVAFHTWLKLPAIVADCVLAWLVQGFLGRRGAGEWARLAGLSLVALGPLPVAISAYHGQIDSVAILPAALALVLWERIDTRRRVLVCGGLIGLGTAIKWVPLIMLLPLLPHAGSRRQAGMLVGAALTVLLVALAPFAIADPHGVARIFDYKGAPGLGGLGLILQPGLAADWLHGLPLGFSGVSRLLYDHGTLLTLAAIVAMGATVWRLRPSPEAGAVLVWLTLYVFSANFFLQYMVWGLPFFLMSGYLRRVAQLQGLLLAPIVLTYGLPWQGSVIPAIYAAIMIGVWLALVVALVGCVRRARLIRAAPLAVAA